VHLLAESGGTTRVFGHGVGIAGSPELDEQRFSASRQMVETARKADLSGYCQVFINIIFGISPATPEEHRRKRFRIHDATLRSNICVTSAFLSQHFHPLPWDSIWPQLKDGSAPTGVAGGMGNARAWRQCSSLATGEDLRRLQAESRVVMFNNHFGKLRKEYRGSG